MNRIENMNSTGSMEHNFFLQILRQIYPIFCKISVMPYNALFTAVWLVYNPFSQLGPQLTLYSQLQLSLLSDPITLGFPNSR